MDCECAHYCILSCAEKEHSYLNEIERITADGMSIEGAAPEGVA